MHHDMWGVGSANRADLTLPHHSNPKWAKYMINYNINSIGWRKTTFIVRPDRLSQHSTPKCANCKISYNINSIGLGKPINVARVHRTLPQHNKLQTAKCIISYSISNTGWYIQRLLSFGKYVSYALEYEVLLLEFIDYYQKLVDLYTRVYSWCFDQKSLFKFCIKSS